MSTHAASSSAPGETPLEVLVSQTLGMASPEEFTELFPVLVQDLADVEQRIHQVLRSTYPRLTEAATYACSTGGKQIRPLLMAVTYRALGATSTQPIHSLAASFQLIHTASLVHDDVIDHAELRRGQPSMPRAFGLTAAIVAGDYLFVRAFELAADYSRSIILRCGDACAELVEGEVLQESSRFDLTTGREHYFRVVERKTAAIVAAALASVAETLRGAPRGHRRARDLRACPRHRVPAQGRSPRCLRGPRPSGQTPLRRLPGREPHARLPGGVCQPRGRAQERVRAPLLVGA